MIEADERVDAARRRARRRSTKTSLRHALDAARRDGLRSVAIAFLHWRAQPGRTNCARPRSRSPPGFEEVVASHDVAPLVGLIARGDSAVADAYLSPVLLRYVRQFLRELADRHGAPRSCC